MALRTGLAAGVPFRGTTFCFGLAGSDHSGHGDRTVERE
jgi:hypothetical protein